MRSFVVKLDVQNRGALLSARCAAVPGLHIYGRDLEGVRRIALSAIPGLLKANRQMTVEINSTADPTEFVVSPAAQR